MALNQIVMPTHGPRGENTMDQIAKGVDIAATVLGTGLKAYQVFGIEKPEKEAQTNYMNAEASALPTRYGFMQARSNQQGNQLAGGGVDESGKPLTYVPKNEDVMMNSMNMHDKVSADKERAVNFRTFKDAYGQIEALRGNPALQIAQRNLLLAQNALDAYTPKSGNLNDVTSSMLALGKLEESKIASGGAPSESELKSISDPTMVQGLQKLKSEIFNQPEGMGQAAFLPQHIDYLNNLKNNAINFIKETHQRKIDDFGDYLSKTDHDRLQKDMDVFLAYYKKSPSEQMNAGTPSPKSQGSIPDGKIHVSKDRKSVV